MTLIDRIVNTEQGAPLQAKLDPHRITNRSDSGWAAVKIVVVVSSGWQDRCGFFKYIYRGRGYVIYHTLSRSMQYYIYNKIASRFDYIRGRRALDLYSFPAPPPSIFLPLYLRNAKRRRSRSRKRSRRSQYPSEIDRKIMKYTTRESCLRGKAPRPVSYTHLSCRRRG